MRIVLKRYGDLIVTSVIFVICLVLLLITDTIISTSSSRVGAEQLGAAFWPKLILITIVILSAILIIQSIRKIKNTEWDEKEEKEDLARFTDFRLIFLMGLTIIYVSLLQYVGFLILTPIYLILVCWLIEIKSIIKNVVYSFLLTGILIYVFASFLYVPLPRGIGIFRELSYYFY